MLLAVMMIACCGSAMAQQKGPDGRQRMNREQFAEKQAQHIAQTLAFSDDVTKKFVATYCECQKEIWALGPRGKRNKADATDEEVGQNIKNRFAMSEKLLKIRQKYYEEYSKFLTQKQIEQVYAQERKMMSRFSKRGKGGGKDAPNRKRPDSSAEK